MVHAITRPASDKEEGAMESPKKVSIAGDAAVVSAKAETTDVRPAPQASLNDPPRESAPEVEKVEDSVKTTMQTEPVVEPVPMAAIAAPHSDAAPAEKQIQADTAVPSPSRADDDMEVDQEALNALATLDEHPPAILTEPPAAPPSDSTPAPTLEPAPALSAPAPDASRPPIAPPPTTLEQSYSPFVLPHDTSLTTARSRLRTALEQTRLLRQSFTEQVYERYGVILKAVPSHSENEALLSEICADPLSAARRLEVAEAEKKRERERSKAENEGENDPLASFGGDGLHLVVLPEEQSQLEEGKRGGVVISAASAAATEGLLDRIRRSRGLATFASESNDEKRRKSGEYTVESLRGRGGAGADRSLASSPSLSVDSHLGGGGQQHLRQPQGLAVQPSRKSGYSAMFTLSPEGESLLKNKKYNAVQSALLSRGVGVSEMKRDPRVGSSLVMHQRAIPKGFYETALPQLLGARQVGRMEVRRVHARRAVRSVIREIMGMEREDEEKLERLGDGNDGEEQKKDDGNDDKDGKDGQGSSEIGLFNRLKSLSDQHHEKNGTSDQGRDKSNGNGDSGGKATGSTTANLEIDPILAYSVMNAVGLIQVKDEKDVVTQSPCEKADSETSIAKTLGLSSLTNLSPVSDFVKSFLPVGNGNKRKQSEDPDNNGQEAKKLKVDAKSEEGKDEVLHIRGGGGNEPEEKPTTQPPQRQTSGSAAPAPSNANMTNNNLSLFQQPSLYNLNPAAIGSLASSLDAYQSAALAHQLGIPMGRLPSYQIGAPGAPDLSDFFLRSQLAAANADRTSLGSTNLSHTAILSGQLNFSLRDQQEAVTAMILREQQNVAAAAAAAAHYQVALSSLATQNPYSAYTGPIQASLSSQPAAAAAATKQSQLKTTGVLPQPNEANPSRPLQRKRSRSLGTDGQTANSPKRPKSKVKNKEKQTSPLARPASAPVQPPPVILPDAVVTVKEETAPPDVNTANVCRPELHFTPPEPPQGLSPEIAQLILDSKFHEAYALSHEKSDQSEDLLVEFLLSLAAAVPIPKTAISDTVRNELAKRTSLKEFAGESTFASVSRDVIVATIAVCLWAKHEKYYKESFLTLEPANANPKSNTIIKFAVDKSLSALAAICESHSSDVSGIRKGEVASIVNKSLMMRVVINNQMDASLPMMDDILGLLDSLRMEALKAKVQERVLLATLVARHGKMSETFSNSYVSAIIRAGEALGHEDVCEIAQDEKCRASTMLPYDFFHDQTGLWEEPCRPPLGVYPDSTGKELKRRAHAKTVIQKSMKKLQNCLGLKGGVSDGGPYYSDSATGVTAPSPVSTPTASQAVLVRTNSSNLKRKGSQTWDTSFIPGTATTGVPDSIFNPGHWIAPMPWDLNDASNTPYGRHQVGIRPSIVSVGGSTSESKWKKLEKYPLALRYRSTHEVKWEDVADMFLHGGSTRKIVLDLGGDTSIKKKNIIAPFVRPFDVSSIKAEGKDDEEISYEDVSDETVLRRHQEILDDMMRKLVAVTEKKQQQSQPRGRKKQT
eukprot:CCRYP_006699-RA/>CCRYP_006699-RA protein AED:0.01 eAED:0.01 QI:265/1/1/1/1/1/3/77/1518